MQNVVLLVRFRYVPSQLLLAVDRRPGWRTNGESCGIRAGRMYSHKVRGCSQWVQGPESAYVQVVTDICKCVACRKMGPSACLHTTFVVLTFA